MQINPADNYVVPKPPEPKNNYLSQDIFLKLLVVQLQTQDPLSPMNDRDFFAQLAQLGTVQGIDSLKKSNDLAQASAMLGRTVEVFRPGGIGDFGARVEVGVVEAAEVRSGKTYIRVNGGQYALDQVMRITE